MKEQQHLKKELFVDMSQSKTPLSACRAFQAEHDALKNLHFQIKFQLDHAKPKPIPPVTDEEVRLIAAALIKNMTGMVKLASFQSNLIQIRKQP